MQMMPLCNQKGTWKPCFDVSFRHAVYLSLICLIKSTSWEETAATQRRSHSKSAGPWMCSQLPMVAAGTSDSKIKSALLMSSLMPSKNRRALMKIQLANNVPNHRLDSDLRGLKVTLHEYLVTPRCHGWLVGRLLGGGPYLSLLNKQGK